MFSRDEVVMSNAGPVKKSVSFPTTGLVRLSSILAPAGPIPVSRSGWWAGVRSGRYPTPIKLGPRITAWRVEDINMLINDGIKEK
jgi:predicted DNA-binding transcriptional regulator AlpA